MDEELKQWYEDILVCLRDDDNPWIPGIFFKKCPRLKEDLIDLIISHIEST